MIKLTNQECAILLCGFIRGALSSLNRKLEDEPMIISALKQLGCPVRYLPEEK